MEYIFSGTLERQDAINSLLKRYLNSKPLVTFTIIYAIFSYIVVSMLTNKHGEIFTTDLASNVIVLFVFLIEVPSLIYFAVAIKAETRLKKSNIHDIYTTVNSDIFVYKTKIGESEIKKENIQQVIYTKKYIILRTKINRTKDLITLKRSWLTDESNWEMVNEFIKAHWDPKARMV